MANLQICWFSLLLRKAFATHRHMRLSASEEMIGRAAVDPHRS
jgi:hypothetical protein